MNNTVPVPKRLNYIDHIPQDGRKFIAKSYNGTIRGKNQTKSRFSIIMHSL